MTPVSLHAQGGGGGDASVTSSGTTPHVAVDSHEAGTLIVVICFACFVQWIHDFIQQLSGCAVPPRAPPGILRISAPADQLKQNKSEKTRWRTTTSLYMT